MMQRTRSSHLVLTAVLLVVGQASGVENVDCADVGLAADYNLSPCEFVDAYCVDDAYSRTYYCASGAGKGFFIAACVVWLGLLFLLLGSTADDYFSPALEQFSTKLGLPPRFAGVTLLALGNGAPDVSSTIASINQGGDGYLLSLGALTGAGMFVGTVVAGSVMVAADGVRAKGALLRDVTTYLATCCLVLTIFSSGEISLQNVYILLCCYFSFVSVVLAADIYHRTVVLPGERKVASVAATQSPGFGLPPRAVPGNAPSATIRESLGGVELGSAISAVERMRQGLDGGDGGLALPNSPKSTETSRALPPSTREKWGPTGGAGKHDIDGVTNHRAQYIIMHADSDVFDEDATASVDFAGFGSGGVEGYQSLDDFPDLPGFNGGDVINGSTARGSPREGPELSVGARLKQEVVEGWGEFLEMSVVDKTLYTLEWPFMVLRRLSVPITADENYCKPWLLLSVALMPLWFVGYYLDMASATIGGAPLLSDDDGNGEADDAGYEYAYDYAAVGRRRVLSVGEDDEGRRQLGGDGGGGGFPVLLLAMLISVPCSAGLHLVCSDVKPPPTVIAAVLALVGFAIAATWIDTIANQLVSTLGFFGTLLGIPQPVLGLTVLAWGNSIGDYSTNMAMARKGLSNMAMTACFAGPVFNMLIGTGVGFSMLLNSNDPDVVDHTFRVSLSPGIIAGFSFLILNCACIAAFGIFNKNFVPKEYGYASGAMYVVYLIVSFLLLFEAF